MNVSQTDLPGKLVTFEGIEGSGKTTQLRILEDHLKLRRHQFISTREPGGTRIGDSVRKLLLNPEHREMQAMTELLLYEAARAQHIAEKILPALEAGKLVLCDRFTDATLAYQGGARGISFDLIGELNRMATGGLEPNLTFLLDCPVEVGLRRARDRYQVKDGAQGADRIEQEELKFHESVRENYLAIAKRESQRVVVFDGNQDVDSIHQSIIAEIQRLRIFE